MRFLKVQIKNTCWDQHDPVLYQARRWVRTRVREYTRWLVEDQVYSNVWYSINENLRKIK